MSSHSPLDQAVERYLLFLRAEENKSPLTLSNYRQSLNLFLTLSPLSDVSDIGNESVRMFKGKLQDFRTKQGKELAILTKNHHLTVLRAFLRYLVQEEEMDTYPPDRVKRFKEEQRKVKVLFKDDLDRLLAAPDLSSKNGKRDAAILELFSPPVFVWRSCAPSTARI